MLKHDEPVNQVAWKIYYKLGRFGKLVENVWCHGLKDLIRSSQINISLYSMKCNYFCFKCIIVTRKVRRLVVKKDFCNSQFWSANNCCLECSVTLLKGE